MKQNKTTNYPAGIVKIAEQYIIKNNTNVKSIIPLYDRGFIAVIEDKSNPICQIIFKPYIQIGGYGKDFIKVDKSTRSYYNYDEAIIALITFKNLGEGGQSVTYIDIFCNKMGVTSNGNSINPNYPSINSY